MIHFTMQKQDITTNYSSIHKLKRVTAYVLRFRPNVQIKKDRRIGYLSISELNKALYAILKLIQNQCFSKELNELNISNRVDSRIQLKALNPFIDNKVLIRVGGPLKNSILIYIEKHPIVLPAKNHLIHLIIRNIHVENLHSGTQATLHTARAMFRPINGKIITKKIAKSCITYFKVNSTNCSYFMSDLPASRVNQARPFLSTGLDFCGPFYIKERKFRNRGKLKVYTCIFVYFTTKVLHIELISDLTTESFIAGLRRFFARRGLSAVGIYIPTTR
jgi:hypothetical protein